MDAAVLTGNAVKSVLELAFDASAVKQRVTTRVNARHAEAAAREEQIFVQLKQPIPIEDFSDVQGLIRYAEERHIDRVS